MLAVVGLNDPRPLTQNRCLISHPPGEGSGDGHRTSKKRFLVSSLQLLSLCSSYGGAGSPLAWRPPVSPTAFVDVTQPRSREAGSKRCYGIANLLPLIVSVKGETPQVVSPAMTGLVRGCQIGFPQQFQPQLPIASGPVPCSLPPRKTAAPPTPVVGIPFAIDRRRSENGARQSEGRGSGCGGRGRVGEICG
jgi:hypothetical protein